MSNRKDKIVVGNEVSCVHFPTNHQAMITNGRIHEVVMESEHPYIVIMSSDSSTIMILLNEIRTLQKK